jgi:hypothetical protein
MKASSSWRGSSLCEEFSDYVLTDDDNNNSILVCIPIKHFGTVYRELTKLGYKMVFKTKIKTSNSLTCTFIKI